MSNQQKLVNAIVIPVKKVVNDAVGEFGRNIAIELADLKIQIGGITAQLAVLELATGSSTPSKRAPRGARKTSPAIAGRKGAIASGNADPYDKVKNAMLFTRRMTADSDEFRERYLTPQVLTVIDQIDRITKHTKNSESYYLLAGSELWKTIFTEDQKNTVRDEFKRWKEERMRAQLESPLAPDATPATPATPKGLMTSTTPAVPMALMTSTTPAVPMALMTSTTPATPKGLMTPASNVTTAISPL